MSGIARGRLVEERKCWRKDHPHGFVAKPRTKPDGTQDTLLWDVTIPGKKNTIWEGGRFQMQMHFTDEYPTKPPTCIFTPALFHPNVYDDGKVCLSIINPTKGWKPSTTIKQILIGIQELLDNPNNDDAAQQRPYEAYARDRPRYERTVREFAARFRE